MVEGEESEPDYRFTLANERTFLAWQRTALGLLAAAVAVQFAPALGAPALRHVVGGCLAALALLGAGAGLLRWTQVDKAMRLGRPLPRHRAPGVLAVGLIAIAVLTVLALLLTGAPA